MHMYPKLGLSRISLLLLLSSSSSLLLLLLLLLLVLGIRYELMMPSAGQKTVITFNLWSSEVRTDFTNTVREPWLHTDQRVGSRHSLTWLPRELFQRQVMLESEAKTLSTAAWRDTVQLLCRVTLGRCSTPGSVAEQPDFLMIFIFIFIRLNIIWM